LKPEVPDIDTFECNEVRKGNPAKQGLKQEVGIRIYAIDEAVRKGNPAKQGLKH